MFLVLKDAGITCMVIQITRTQNDRVFSNYDSPFQKVSVHCAWGRGRTGTFMACYLAKEKGLTSTEAMELVRNMRPGSIDTEHQEQTVHDYVATLKK